MSAETLRKAAALMRERANGFITEDSTPPRVNIDKEGTCDGCAQYLRLVASYPDDESEPWLCAPCAAYVDHQAGWTQRVALAVSDLLYMAGDHEAGQGRGETCPSCAAKARAVARAYLKGSAP